VPFGRSDAEGRADKAESVALGRREDVVALKAPEGRAEAEDPPTDAEPERTRDDADADAVREGRADESWAREDVGRRRSERAKKGSRIPTFVFHTGRPG
jgi:hypothetical protein